MKNQNEIPEKPALLELSGAGLSIKRREKLVDLNLSIYNGDFIGIYGLNGSGKSLLAEILGGEIYPDSGGIYFGAGISAAVVSSAERKRMLEEDRHNDDSEFMQGKTDPGRSVMDIFRPAAGESLSVGGIVDGIDSFIEMFDIRHILYRGIKFLSTGEFRKMMIIRALLSKPDILILDDPYTGLDIETRGKLQGLIDELRGMVKSLILISGRLEDINDVGRCFFLNNKRLSGYPDTDGIRMQLAGEPSMPLTEEEEPDARLPEDSVELIKMANVGMMFYEEKILTDINWKVRSGEHWQIGGPNGSGKSSLLSLITGDSPKAYGQEIYLFGRKRGSGETVWDIKQKMGYVSGTLQRMHRISQNVLSIVVSGFFDTIGLYDRPDPVQIEKARGWCFEFGMDEYLNTPFDQLSEGMKRAVLIIRAIVKQPELLILDEPCQGLDDQNAGFILAVARRVIKRGHSTLLYVSHDPVYRMEEITNIIELVPHFNGGYTGRIS